MINEAHIQIALKKLKTIENEYLGLIFEPLFELPVSIFETTKHYHSVPDYSSNFVACNKGREWGAPFSYAWFKGEFAVPRELAGKKLFVRAKTNGHETLFFVDKKPKGIFNNDCNRASLGNHHMLLLSEDAVLNQKFELAFESYSGHKIVGTQPYETPESQNVYPCTSGRIFESIEIGQCNELIKDFVFDLRILNQLASSLPDNNFRKWEVAGALIKVLEVISAKPGIHDTQYIEETLKMAREIMMPVLAKKNTEGAPFAGLIGHSHMDTAWLWTIDETVHKCARTYSNALSLMGQYPEYKFVQSSMYHTELMRLYYPDIFEGIREMSRQNRWELIGGAWIECDCNISSGEMLIRQFLKGQSYLKEHFGIQSEVFWLPDTFGYSAALPQILNKCGIKYFLTTKLTWNDTNTFPMDTFKWKGLDGSEVLVHFNDIHCWPDAETLINKISGSGPKDFRTAKNYIQHKIVNAQRLISYGFGDGGGGPQYEMLETARRCKDLEGCPKSEHILVKDFMYKLEAESNDIPKYAGELYVEGHRGTLTQIHDIKKCNRQAEVSFRNAEIIDTIGFVSGGKSHKSELDEIMGTLLVNQFHDILPGTSIPEVNSRAIAELKDIKDRSDSVASSVLGCSGESEFISLFNSLSFARSGQLEIETQYEAVKSTSITTQAYSDLDGIRKLAIKGITIAPFATVNVELCKNKNDSESESKSSFAYSDNTLQTPFATIIFDSNGYICSFYDKTAKRFITGGNNPLNTFLMGECVPLNWDNWDIDADIKYKLKPQNSLLTEEIISGGELQFRIRRVYKIGSDSSLTQDMIFYNDSPRIDFDTKLDWKDVHGLLKVSFDVDLTANQARSEVQYGYAERSTSRNNSYEQAMFEVCNHKWTDISENGYGTAILNDCKYGISVEETHMQLTLNKGGRHPDPNGDVGVHRFKYAFLPHNCAFGTDSVIKPAYLLNYPLIQSPGKSEFSTSSFLEVESENIIVEAIKEAEKDKAYVIRMYECEKTFTNTKLNLSRSPSKVFLTDLLENEIEQIICNDRCMELTFKPFEIKTVKVYF